MDLGRLREIALDQEVRYIPFETGYYMATNYMTTACSRSLE